MSRKTKFRGKEKKTGWWVVGDLHTAGCLPHIHDNGGKHYIDLKTVGQFTGKKDCIEQDIYDGDILKWEYDHTDSGNFAVGMVYYDEEQTCYMISYTDYRSNYRDSDNNIEYLYCLESDDIEIVGNIYDSPELINNYV